MANSEQDRDLPSLLHAIDREAYALQQFWAGKDVSVGGAELARRLADAYGAMDRAVERCFQGHSDECRRGEL